jgi:pimeloyl-ACP methyl ester carboxylesterase
MSARRAIHLLLLAQILLAGALAWIYLRYGGIESKPLALLLGAATILVVRMLVTANSFLVSTRFRSPTPPAFALGLRERLAMFGEEYVSTMLQSSWFMARAQARERIYQDSPAPPVLLLHGYGSNSGYWTHLCARLDAGHVSNATLDLEPLFGDIDEYMPIAARAIEQLCQRSGAPQVVIVAHSMGGLVARACLAAHGAGRIARIITIGTPHQGTQLARRAPGRSAAQMLCSGTAGDTQMNSWLHTLDASETPAMRELITCLFTHHDNIVAPQVSGQLPGARNIAFGGVGHVALGRNKRVLDFLMQEIVRARMS